MTQTIDSSYKRVSIESLQVGKKLSQPIFDDASPVLLIAAGTKLTPHLLEMMRRRGVQHVRVGAADLKTQVRQRVELKEETRDPNKTRWSNGKPPFLKLTNKAAASPKNQKLAAEFTEKLSDSVVRTGDVFVSLASGQSVSGVEITKMIHECLTQILDDVDLFVSLGTSADTDQYPISHSIQTTRLAMAIGAVMGVDKESLMDIGGGCLLHDAGMLRLAPDLLTCERPLDVIEKLDITKHPAYTFEMIQDIPELSVGARMIAYQMHERMDGSGYPRKISGSRIHPYSRIAMVADVYVAMTSPRPQRPAFPPYYAVLELLEETNAGRFDPDVMTGFLNTVSMFPLGSSIELTNGQIGTVLRANQGLYARPVVEVWNPGEPDKKTIVDLKEHEDLAIARPLLSV